MFGSKLKHRKENRHHEKLHTPPARTCPEPNNHCPAGSKSSVLFVGLDVHNDSIAVSLAPSDSTEVRRYGIIGEKKGSVLDNDIFQSVKWDSKEGIVFIIKN